MVVSKRKRWCCAKSKTRHMLDQNCPEAAPTPEDSGISLIDWSVTPRENLALVEPECSIDIFHSAKSQLNFSLLVEEAGGENSSIGGTSSDSDSGSDSESSADTYSQLESLAAPTIPSEIYLSINNFI